MCGICGEVTTRPGREPNEEALRAMVAALRFELSLRSDLELPLLIRQPMHHTFRGPKIW